MSSVVRGAKPSGYELSGIVSDTQQWRSLLIYLDFTHLSRSPVTSGPTRNSKQNHLGSPGAMPGYSSASFEAFSNPYAIMESR